MTQERNAGAWRLLSNPRIYEFFQMMTGIRSARRKYRDYIRAEPGLQILDIGCGPGSFASYLPRDIKYLGIDTNSAYIETARKKYAIPGFEFECASVSDITFHDRKYDRVLAIGVLHHLNDKEVDILMREARSCLDSKGFLFCVDPVYHEGQGILSKFVTSMDRGRFVRTEEEYKRLAKPYFSRIESHIDKNVTFLPCSGLIAKYYTDN